MGRFRGVGAGRGAAPTRRSTAASLDDDATLDGDPPTCTTAPACLVDPHTAVGIGAARAGRRPTPTSPMVCLATAHPAKFPDAVEQATGIRPPLPDHLADLFDRAERYDVLPNDVEAVRAHVPRVDLAPDRQPSAASRRSAADTWQAEPPAAGLLDAHRRRPARRGGASAGCSRLSKLSRNSGELEGRVEAHLPVGELDAALALVVADAAPTGCGRRRP